MAEPTSEYAGNGDDDGIIRLGGDDDGIRGSETFVDPTATLGGRTGTLGTGAAEPKRRGRKPGGKNKPRAEKAGKLDLGPFSGVILGVHTMLASIAKVPELELDAEEADKLAKASQAVMRHYVDLDVSQKAADWTNLFMAIGGIYGPRIVASKIRRSRVAAERKQTVNHPPVHAAPEPQSAGGGAPNVGASVVQFPVSLTGGFDTPGATGGPGVG